jgi:integrase
MEIVDVRRRLMEGTVAVPAAGSVATLVGAYPPFTVVDGEGQQAAEVTAYLSDVMLNDSSPATCRSYAYDLLRWYRVLWLLGVDWRGAHEADVAAMVGWLRVAENPQRRRRAGAPPAGSVNLRTGKPFARPGYAPRTINHALSVISGFYAYHQHHGRGPATNPVPDSSARRSALAHRSPLAPPASFRRARLRQKVDQPIPRAIPDPMWDELFAAMTSDRDRALLLFYVSSGARAGELLAIRLADVDWSEQRIYVVSKGTRLRQPVPASPKAFLLLAAYLDEAGLPEPGQPIWRTQRGESRPLSYWAMRRVLQRANARLGTNWTLHDLRHTAATRMANDPHLTLTEVRAILRHSNLATTGLYLTARVEDLFDKLQEHYTRPRPAPSLPAGYDPADMATVFGA